MMELIKYHAQGNDFLCVAHALFAAIEEQQRVDWLRGVCHRRFGIGADGVIVYDRQGSIGFYNADGSAADFCGNGAACAFHLLAGQGILREHASFVFGSRQIACAFAEDGYVEVSFTSLSPIVPKSVGYVMHTGVPHLVICCPQLEDEGLMDVARHYRYSLDSEQGGVNVNFYTILAADRIAMRTYERGVEGETYSCGSGTVATALVYVATQSPLAVKTGGTIFVESRGGVLRVHYRYHSKQGVFDSVRLCSRPVVVATLSLADAWKPQCEQRLLHGGS